MVRPSLEKYIYLKTRMGLGIINKELVYSSSFLMKRWRNVMKIGLVRHFKVRAAYPDKLSSAEYLDWLRLYDRLEVDPTHVDLRGISWNRCYASSLPRAYKTARAIYDGEIIQSEKIVEVDLKFRKGLEGLRSVVDWGELSSREWRESTGVSGEDLDDTRLRVDEFLDSLETEVDPDDRILIVCHELVMTVLEGQLRRRGFEGEKTEGAENGDLFVLEK